jgi:hypothetical protein
MQQLARPQELLRSRRIYGSARPGGRFPCCGAEKPNTLSHPGPGG